MPSTTFNLPAPLHHMHCPVCGKPGNHICQRVDLGTPSLPEPILPKYEPIEPIFPKLDLSPGISGTWQPFNEKRNKNDWLLGD